MSSLDKGAHFMRTGCHSVGKSGLTMSILHRQRLSIGLVPALKKALIALCHELHIANSYGVSTPSWVLGFCWIDMGQKTCHHPCARAGAKILMCIERVCCKNIIVSGHGGLAKGEGGEKRHVIACNACNGTVIPCNACNKTCYMHYMHYMQLHCM